MKIGVMRAGFYLHGCGSLKEKRRRLGRVRDKFGKASGLAVCESRYPDDHKRSEWTFVAVASAGTVVQQALTEVETFLATSVDAELISVDREWLA